LQGELVVLEYRIVRSDGVVRNIRDTMFPIRDGDGRTTCIGGIGQDITAHVGFQTYVIDPDARSRPAITHILQRAGYAVKAFTSGTEFLDVAAFLATGCIVLDSQGSPTAGLDLLRQLRSMSPEMPVIVIGVSSGDVKIAVQAMKSGAFDWLEVPYQAKILLAAVASGLAAIRDGGEEQREAVFARTRIASMSMRERQVLEGLLAGGSNKEIGRELEISPRTVELHRRSVMERLGVRTLSEAVLIATAAGVRPAIQRRKSHGRQ
jgi:FixJ family two-component response regulator